MEFANSFLPVFMKYVLGFFAMRAVGEYLLFLGRFTQEMTVFLIAGSSYHKKRKSTDEEDVK